MYCEPEDSLGRRSCQTVLEKILDGVTRSIAPVLPHLAEEVYAHTPGHEGIRLRVSVLVTTSRAWTWRSVAEADRVSAETQTLFRSGWIQSTSVWLRPGVEEMLEGACAIRDSFLSSIPGKNPAKYDLTIAIKPGLLFELMEVNHGSVNGKDVRENPAGCKLASPALWVVRSSVRPCIAKLKILQYAAKLAIYHLLSR